MAQMVGDMLYLAQADNGLLRPGLETVDLSSETTSLFDYFEAWAEERGVSLVQTGSASVPGDRLMLRRALSNLLSTPSGIPHKATRCGYAETPGDKAVVTIENQGRKFRPSISPGSLTALPDRSFTRTQKRRRRAGARHRQVDH